MRLSVVKNSKNETVIYNPATFTPDEDIIIFPFKEFDKFYNETVSRLNIIKGLIHASLDPNSSSNPLQNLNYLLDWINLLEKDVDLLVKFDVQTKLNSFNNIPKKKKSKSLSNLIDGEKDNIQCLIGL